MLLMPFLPFTTWAQDIQLIDEVVHSLPVKVL